MTDDTPVRAGVVGVGSMGSHHARVYRELPDVSLVGIADDDQARASEVASTYGTRRLEPSELLDVADVVSIAVPTRYHHEVAREAIAAGTHALVEKPFVEDLADGRDLIDRAERAGVTLQVGHVERFNPAVEAAERIVDDLDVIALTADRLGPPVDRTAPDGVVLDLMIHDLDVLCELADGRVDRVQADGARDDEYVTASVSFESGTVGSLTASRVTQQKVRTLSITAAQCRVVVDYLQQSVAIHRQSVPEYVETNGGVNYRHASVVERPTIESGEPLTRELRSFVDAATGDSEPRVTPADGLRAVRLARRIADTAGTAEVRR